MSLDILLRIEGSNMSTLYAQKNGTRGQVTQQNIEIYNFLIKHTAGVLSTVDMNGEPYASVVYYDTSPFFTIRFLTKKHTKKNHNLTHNRHATFLVFDEADQITVHISGTVLEISDEETVNQIFRNTLRSSLHTSESCIPPVSKLDAGEHVAYELIASDVNMTAYS